MKKNRIQKVNSLLQEVISEVIRKDVKNPKIRTHITVTKVETSPDITYAKVFVSMIADEKTKAESLKALQSASGFIAVNAHKRLDRMRYFPELSIRLDLGIDEQMKIHEIFLKLEEKKKQDS
jgi:ribosome-binding factor A